MTSSETDRIERSVIIDAARARVWRALADAEEFGSWFGVKLKGQAFVAGQRTRGPITYPGYEHIMFDVVVDRVEHEKLLSFRWHPYAVDPNVDYSTEEPTVVSFTLTDAPAGGILLTVVESGFDKLAPQRRSEAFRMNSGGWDAQMENVRRHVAESP